MKNWGSKIIIILLLSISIFNLTACSKKDNEREATNTINEVKVNKELKEYAENVDKIIQDMSSMYNKFKEIREKKEDFKGNLKDFTYEYNLLGQDLDILIKNTKGSNIETISKLHNTISDSYARTMGFTLAIMFSGVDRNWETSESTKKDIEDNMKKVEDEKRTYEKNKSNILDKLIYE